MNWENFKSNLNEDNHVWDIVQDVAKKHSAKNVKYKGGKSIKLDAYSASALVAVHKALKKKKNQDSFIKTINSSPQGLKKMVDFAFKMAKAGPNVKTKPLTNSMYSESVELDEESKPKQMSPNEKLKIFNKLKPKQQIDMWIDSSMSKGKNWRPFVVGRKSKSAKYNLEKISLQQIGKDGKAGGVKFYLYNRDGKISLAMGDMAASLISMRKSTNESVELDEVKDYRKELEKRHAEAIKIIWAIDTTFGRTKWTDSFGNYVTKHMPDDVDTSIDAGWAYHQNRGRGEWFFTIEPRDVVKYSYTGKAKINSSEKSGRLKIGEFEKFISKVWALTKAKNESVELDEVKWDKDEKRIVPKWEKDLVKATSKVKGIVRGLKNGKEVHSYRTGGTMMASAVGVLLRDFGADTVELVVRGKVVYTVKKKDVMKNGKMIDESVELDELKKPHGIKSDPAYKKARTKKQLKKAIDQWNLRNPKDLWVGESVMRGVGEKTWTEFVEGKDSKLYPEPQDPKKNLKYIKNPLAGKGYPYNESIIEEEPQSGTFKGRAVSKSNAEYKKKKAELDVEIADIQGKLDSIENKREAGRKVSSLEAKLVLVRKKKKDAVERIAQATEKIKQGKAKLAKLRGDTNEDAPVNSAGDGSRIAGLDDEPPVRKKKKKLDARTKEFREKNKSLASARQKRETVKLEKRWGIRLRENSTTRTKEKQ